MPCLHRARKRNQAFKQQATVEHLTAMLRLHSITQIGVSVTEFGLHVLSPCQIANCPFKQLKSIHVQSRIFKVNKTREQENNEQRLTWNEVTYPYVLTLRYRFLCRNTQITIDLLPCFQYQK